MLEPELWLDLDALCSYCQQSFSLTVLCQGEGLSNRLNAALKTTANCPHCGEGNAIVFDKDGVVIEVAEEFSIPRMNSALHN